MLDTTNLKYVKVIILRIDDIESEIVNERNFGCDDTEKINVFIKSYNLKNYKSITLNINNQIKY